MSSNLERTVADVAFYTGAALFAYPFGGVAGAGIALVVSAIYASSKHHPLEGDDE